MRLKGFFLKLIKDSDRSIRERIFILLTISAVAVAVIALIGDIICGENIVEIIALVGIVIFGPLITYFGVKKQRARFAMRFLVIGVAFILMPIIFFFGGGTEGGAVPWLIFTYLYIGLVLSGIWRASMLVLMTLLVILMYGLSYYYPELVIPHTREMFWMDSLLGVIQVGFVCYLMAWFQILVSKEENYKAKQETRKSEELNKSQNNFFSKMSHEIRTPINTILGLNEIILRQENSSEEIRRDSLNIQGAGKMLLALVNDILDFSKIEAGKMDIVPVNYKVSEAVAEIVNMVWLRAEEKGLRLNVDIDPSIPSELFGDEVRIKQILINLLNNAVKYTNEGSVTLHMERQEEKEDQVLLMYSVSDTGIGIKQDALPYLFDVFKRVDEEKNRKIEGTGLGLSIVKQLVDLMDGKIAVNSVYTQGATFTVSLWQKITNKEPVGDISIISNGEAGQLYKYESGFLAPKARILIVDDDAMNLEVEKKLLAETKMVIDIAHSGKEALDMTFKNFYDAILMDHMMPEMDGIECLERIRRQTGGLNNFTPVIVLTANAGSENRKLYNSCGFDGYLVKPVSGSQLEEMLLGFLPETKVEATEMRSMNREELNTSKGYSKKIPVLITTNTISDLPTKLLKDLQIDTIPVSIRSQGKTYYDCIEADADELIRYINEDGREFRSEPPTVEEFEYFFAKELKKAHQIIYLSFSAKMSDEYDRACRAASLFDNVTVVDSGYLSSALGLMVLAAYSMAKQNEPVAKIAEEIEKLKSRIHCSFILAETDFMTKNGFVGKWTNRLMQTAGLKMSLKIKNSMFCLDNLWLGDMQKCYRDYINYALPKNADPNLDLIFITYVDVPEDTIEWIKDLISSKYDFKNIIVQKASAAISLNCGPGTVGILYMTRGEQSFSFDNYFIKKNKPEYTEDYVIGEEASNDNSTEEVIDNTAETQERTADNAEKADLPTDKALEEPKWYENIEGIDGAAAIDHCETEDSLLMVLKIYRDGIPAKSEELDRFFNSENWKDYTIKIHALKGSSRLIGADELADEAFELEKAGKAGDIEYIRENHGKVMDHYIQYKKNLEVIDNI
ncbi:DegV family protein [Butyrivibrio sp. AE3004]|uniref:DegV family protein n=1 Tax=Butyrivibrio sp. AE3004 TaxID=1506994 RepID=UPI00068DBDA4|nr:DegV family protein [Butyrivibrio sp. AE3004]